LARPQDHGSIAVESDNKLVNKKVNKS